ncbi:MAG: hypothetical protein V1810_05060 [Candidatus Beckwithbacteria bacterium]
MKYLIESALAGKTMDILSRLKYPQDFFGSTQVHHLVKFGDSFSGLIGKSEAELPKDEVIVLEHNFSEAKKLMDKINGLAQQIIANNKKYDDLGLCREYFQLAKIGYRMLDKFKPQGIPVSLERAGLVVTRLALGLDQEAIIDNEQRVVTKRTHLIDEPDENLSVTIKWRDEVKLKELNGQEILLADFVNPASGASGAALVVALQAKGLRVAKVNHRSISCTRQGVNFIREEFLKFGVKTSFVSVGECSELNERYYLTGDRAVADAGQVLRHFLPKWYKE